MSKQCEFLLAGAILLLAAAPAGAAEPAEFAVGTAFFELELEHAADNSGIEELSGRMVDAISQPACGQYREESELVLRLSVITGQTFTQIAKSTYLEDESSLTFEASMSVNGAVVETGQGQAVRSPEAVTVTLQGEDADELIFPPDTVFPLGLIKSAIAAARSGKDNLQHTSYDGIGDGRSVRAMSVRIGEGDSRPLTGEEGAKASGLGFDGLMHWPMTFTAFPVAQNGDATPDYSISSVVFENGFSVNSVYDFGRFAMRLKLLEYRPGELADCPAEPQ